MQERRQWPDNRVCLTTPPGSTECNSKWHTRTIILSEKNTIDSTSLVRATFCLTFISLGSVWLVVKYIASYLLKFTVSLINIRKEDILLLLPISTFPYIKITISATPSLWGSSLFTEIKMTIVCCMVICMVVRPMLKSRIAVTILE